MKTDLNFFANIIWFFHSFFFLVFLLSIHCFLCFGHAIRTNNIFSWLADVEVKFSEGAACCVVMASEGYPSKYEKGFPITMSEEARPHVFVAGAALKDGTVVTNGGRVLGVTAVERDLAGAIKKAYERVCEVHFENAFYRHDIGKRAMAAMEDK